MEVVIAGTVFIFLKCSLRRGYLHLKGREQRGCWLLVSMCSVSPAVLHWDLSIALKCSLHLAVCRGFELAQRGPDGDPDMSQKCLMLGKECKPGISDPGPL